MSIELQLCVNILVFTIFLQYINICESISCDPPSKTTEGRLKQRLLCNNYDKDVRPIADSKNTTIVNVAMILKNFDSFDNQDSIYMGLWIAMKWRDDKLKWNKREFDNTSSISINSGDIWNPDLLVYYEDSLKTDKPCKDVHCIIDSDGLVTCIPLCTHKADCETDYKLWPYDIETCEFKIGNWRHNDSEIQLKTERVTDYRKENGFWNIISFKIKNLKESYSWSPHETFPAIKYTIIAQRSSTLVEIYFITPALVLGIFNLMVLWLKPGSFERTNLIFISIYSHVNYISTVTLLIPTNGANIPKAVMYFRNSFMVAAFLLFDVVYKRALLTSKSDVPSWIKTIIATIVSNKIWKIIFNQPQSTSTDNTKNANGSAVVKPEKRADQVSWCLVVHVLDVVTLLALVISYISMIFGWIPISRGSIKTLELGTN